MGEGTQVEEETQSIVAEMQKVRAASLGEVILFAGPNMFHSKVHPHDRALLKAVLNIYDGIDPSQYIQDGDRKIENVLKPKYPVELAVVKVHDVPAPVVCNSGVYNVMTLRRDVKAYVGPEQISEVLRTEGMGLFDKFFEQYVQEHRKLIE
jgi:hypothetical protein